MIPMIHMELAVALTPAIPVTPGSGVDALF
jgi:hypothetical protein